MITKLGTIKSKSRPFAPVVVAVPNSQVFNSAGVLQSQYSHANLQVETRTDGITSTNGRKGQPYLSNRCVQIVEHDWYSGDPAVGFKTNHASPSGWYTMYRGGAGYALSTHATAFTTFKQQVGVTLGSAVLGAGGQGYVNEAFSSIRPDLTTVSIPNFLLDIDDIQRLFKLWKSSVSLAKNLAGAHLNYKFGWKPTVGDLTGLVDAVRSLKDKVKAFEDSLGQTFSGSRTPLNETISKSGSFMFGNDIKNEWHGSVKRSVSVHIKWAPQPLAVMGPFDKVLRSLLDSLGFELNPRIIWDAVPFTFVLDWFFGVGSWLDNFKIDALELPIKLLDSCVQYKEEVKFESKCTILAVGNNLNSVQLPAVVHTSKYFERMPLFPDFFTLSGLGWKLPTLNQATLLVSLGTVLARRK